MHKKTTVMKPGPILSLSAVIIANVACSIVGANLTCAQPNHFPLENQHLYTLWSKTNINILDSEFDSIIPGAAGHVFVASQDPINGIKNIIITFDSQSGDILWRQRVNLPVSILAADHSLIVGETNELSIYDSATGQLKHHLILPAAGPIYGMYWNEGKIFARTGSSRKLVYDSVLDNTSTSSLYPAYTPFVVQKGILYFVDVDGYKAQETSTGRTLWVYRFNENENLSKMPLFTEKSMILLTQLGNIYAINKQTGILRWKLDAKQ